jgi:hypothetical protein
MQGCTFSAMVFAMMKKQVEADDLEFQFNELTECTAATAASKTASMNSELKSLSIWEVSNENALRKREGRRLPISNERIG